MERKSYLSTIALLAIFFDEERNPRGDWEYETSPNPKYKPGEGKAGLFEDIEENGVQTPLWVSKLSRDRRNAIHAKTGVWYDYIAIRGHRRGRILKQLALKHPGRFDQIPAQVYEGLTETEEIQLLIDQIHVKGLSDWGIYLAIKKLALTGLSEDAIGTKIGRSRGYVQAKMRIARSPQVVEDAFKAKAEGKPFVNLTESNLVTLAACRKVDEDSGIFDPNGGPAFNEAWGQLVKTGYSKPKDPTAKTRNQLLDMCNVVKDSILVNVLRYAAGDNVDLNESIHAITTLRERALAWEQLQAEPEPEPTPAESDRADSDPAPTPAEPTPAEPTPAESSAMVPFETEPEPTPADPEPEPEPTPAESSATVPFETESADPEPEPAPRKSNRRNKR